MKAIGRSDRTIEPGETQQLKFSLSSSKYTGKFTKKISVTTNDRQNVSTVLTCVGTVKVPFKLEPKTVSFGRIARESESVTRTVTITRGDGGPLALELMPLTETDQCVTATLNEVEAGEMYELEIVAKPPWPNTSVRANIRLNTGVAEAPTETIRVYGMVTPRLAAVPNRLHIPPGKTEEMDVQTELVWSGGEPGHVIEATTSDEETSVRIEQKDDGKQYVVMHVPAGYSPARGRAYVTLKTDDPVAPSLRIPVYAATVGPARPPIPTRSPAAARPTGVAPRVPRPPTAAKPPAPTTVNPPTPKPAEEDD